MSIEVPIQGIPRGFTEIGRTKLTAVADVITVNIPSGYRYLQIMIDTITAGNTDAVLRFNNDSGVNYVFRLAVNGAADSLPASTTGIALRPTGAAADILSVVFVAGAATAEKKVWTEVYGGVVGVGNSPGRRELMSKWTNIVDSINRVDVINSDTGDYAVGSEVVVLGLM